MTQPARFAWVAGWGLLCLLTWVAMTRILAFAWPASLLVPLQSATPWIFLPVYPMAALAIWRHRWLFLGLCALLAVVHAVTVAPAVHGHKQPSWARKAPTVRVFEANVYDHNSDPRAAAAMIVRQPVDVLVLVEVTDAMRADLIAAGIDRAFPHHTVSPYTSPVDEYIYSRLPFVQTGIVETSSRAEYNWVGLKVGDAELAIVAMHVVGAKHGYREWREDFTGIRRYARQTDGPVAIIGDFNANRWNPPFADLLSAGLVDSHEETGKGMSFSWPRWTSYTPVVRIDHALHNGEVVARSVENVVVPGSDHVGFVATLAVEQDRG